MMNRFSVVLMYLLLVCTIAIPRLLTAQTTFGSLVGTISDNSGAVAPGAKVSLRNLGTGEEHAGQSGSNGEYRFLNLQPGSYRLTVEREGFDRVVREPIEVRVQAEVRIDAALRVGAVSQTVEISAETPLLETESASVSTVVDAKTVDGLALNGRNVMNLIALAPGVIAGTGATGAPIGNANGGSMTTITAWMNYQIGGGQLNQSAALLDGAPLNISQNNSAVLVPTQDAVQEFRVVSNDVSAEFGRFAGGVVNLTTKAGTNTMHGSAYEFLRNKELNANAFFNNLGGLPRPQFTQNQYGAQAGGPIKKDKLFFFFSWENFIFRQQTPSLFSVPTGAMRAGDFSAAGLPKIYDPLTVCGALGNASCPTSNGSPVYTRQPFPGNIIPPSRFNPTALVIQNQFGLPNGPGLVNNYFANQWFGGPEHQYVPRLDYNLSDKQRIFGRYTYWNGFVSPGMPFLPPADQKAVGNSNAWQTHNAVIGDNYVISPTTIANVRVSFLRFGNQSIGATYPANLAQFGPGFASLQNQVAAPIYPQTSIQNFFANIGGFGVTFATNSLYTIAGDVTQIMGSHTIKIGGEIRQARWDQFTGNGPGQLSYNNGFTAQNPLSAGSTGYGMASFLLGLPASGTANVAQRTGMYSQYAGLYVTDTWQFSRNLTVTAGLRWDYPGSFSERHGMGAVFEPGITNALAQSTGLPLQGVVALLGSDPVSHGSVFAPHYKLFAPRLGLAYRLNPVTVIKAGYALAYIPSDTALGATAPSAGPVNTAATTYVATLDGGVTPANTLSNPYPNGLIQPSGRNQTALLAATQGQTITLPLGNIRYPYVQQWNLNIGRELGHGMMTEVGYAGLKGTHLPLAGNPNINQLPDQYDAQAQALVGQVKNPFAGKILVGTLASGTLNAGQLLRPFPQYQNVQIPSWYVGNSTYNSLQARFQKRFGQSSGGGVFNVAYTWSKLLSNTDSVAGSAVQDWNNVAAGKSLSSDNAAQRLVINYVIDLPIGHGKALLPNLNGVLNQVVSGWGVNGITTLQSGQPLTITSGSTNILNSTFGAGTIRPNVVAGCKKDVGGSAVDRLNSGQWFNTACFTAPNSYSFGNESRVDSQLRGQGITNFDVALFRNIAFTERYKLQFRAEAFNLANHTRFSNPGTSFGTSSFGVVSPGISSQANSPRLMQLALRLSF